MNEFEAKGDIIVLAGDIFYLRDTNPPQKRFWDWASESFQHILLIPGNHEFYSNSDVTARGDSWQWLGSLLNGAFATELGHFIADSRIGIWIYGHSHTNIDTTIGKTKIISNQLGYIHYNEHLTNGFESNKVIEI